MANNSWQKRLDARRGKSASPYEQLRGPNTGAWEKIRTPLRRAAQAAGWSRGYNKRGVWQ